MHHAGRRGHLASPGLLLTLLATACGPATGGGQPPGERGEGELTTADADAALLIRGRILPDTLILEPLFLLEGPRMAGVDEGGPHRVVGRDADGGTIFEARFQGTQVADAAGGEEHFQVLVPVAERVADGLERVELRTGDGRVARRTSATRPGEIREALAAGTAVSATRSAAGRVRLSWAGERFPALMIRDPQTGEVLAFARDGELTLPTDRDRLEVTVSDGVRSARGLVDVR